MRRYEIGPKPLVRELHKSEPIVEAERWDNLVADFQ
jgi:hypothetical protein